MSTTVNGELLDSNLVERELAELTERYSRRMPPEEVKANEAQIVKDAKQNAVERLLLLQEARKAFPDVAPEEVDRGFIKLAREYGGPATADMSPEDIEQLRKAIAEDIRMQKYLEQLCKDVPAPTDDECRAYYEEHKGDFVVPEMVRASHIVRQPEPGDNIGLLQASMLNVRERAAKKEDFAELARQYSSCDDNGGDLGWFRRGMMVEAFDDIVFALKPGEVSEVFRTQFGFHIVKVHEKRPSTIATFEKVRDHLGKVLHDERKNEEIGRVVDRMRETAKIEETDDKV